jgi:hypothetical protein
VNPDLSSGPVQMIGRLIEGPMWWRGAFFEVAMQLVLKQAELSTEEDPM